MFEVTNKITGVSPTSRIWPFSGFFYSLVKRQQVAMATAYDEKKLETAVLALLYFGSFERPGGRCTWKNYDWSITERLIEQGLIYDPRNKNKSLVFTPEGEARAKAALEALFGTDSAPKGGRPAKARKGKRARSG